MGIGTVFACIFQLLNKSLGCFTTVPHSRFFIA